MAPLLLDLKSPAVDLVLQWQRDSRLVGFDLLGRVDEGVPAWSQDLLKKQQLTRSDFGNHGIELDLSDQKLGEEHVKELAQCLPQDKALTGVHLARTGIRDNCVELLSKALSNCSLQVLNLSHNALGAEACESLVPMLKNSTSLRMLDIGGNRIASAGAAAISAALMENDFLTDLDLSSNGITDEGAECLAAAVEANPHALALLDLSGNCISTDGAEMLSAVFSSVCPHGKLHLGGGPARLCWPLEANKAQPFLVRCIPGDVRIQAGQRATWDFAGRPEPPAKDVEEQAGGSTTGLEVEMSVEQEDDELDVCFKGDGIKESNRQLMSVEISETHLLVRAHGCVLLDSELYGAADPSESSWTVRDGILEIYLVKAHEGEEWPRLMK